MRDDELATGLAYLMLKFMAFAFGGLAIELAYALVSYAMHVL